MTQPVATVYSEPAGRSWHRNAFLGIPFATLLFCSPKRLESKHVCSHVSQTQGSQTRWQISWHTELSTPALRHLSIREAHLYLNAFSDLLHLCVTFQWSLTNYILKCHFVILDGNLLDTILFEANEAIVHIEKKGVSILWSISVIICRKKYEREGKNKTNYTRTHNKVCNT